MKQFTHVILDELGIHARPAGLLVKEAAKLSSSASTGEYAKRYGFIYVDQHDDGSGTMERRKKKSFDWYKKVVATNREIL